MEVSGRRPAYSEDWDTGIPCNPCLLGKTNENAEFFCIFCNEFLCETCARNHKLSKASRQHQLLDRDEMPRKKLSNVQDKFCAKHDGKLIEYFCGRHATLCCSVCITLDHGQCGVKYIDDLAKNFSSSQEYKSLLKQIHDLEKQLAEDKNKKQYDSVDVTNCFTQLQADIKIFRSEIIATIDALEHELIHQAKQTRNEDLKAIESTETLYNKLLEDMSEMSSTLGLLEKCKENETLFISAKKAQIQVKEFNDIAQSMLHENSIRRYAFSGNEDILKTLNSPRKLGSLETHNEGDRITTKSEQTGKGLLREYSRPTIGKLSIGSTDERGNGQITQNKKTVKTVTFESTKFKFMKDVKMNHINDKKEVLITGSALMPNDRLALVDQSNYSIKVMDLLSDTITGYTKLDDKPWDITCMDPNTLVVTCDTYLVFLRYDGKLSVVRKVPMEPSCMGITNRMGELFVTFVGKHSSVKILNHKGKVLQTFKYNAKGQNLFDSPQYITVNRDGDTMYVSDWDQNTVTCMDMNGAICNIYRYESLNRPEGLTLGDGDSVYVAGCLSNNIHQITPTCTPVRIVLEETDGLNHPWTVLYNNTHKTLYVSNGSSGNLLKVYKFE